MQVPGIIAGWVAYRADDLSIDSKQALVHGNRRVPLRSLVSQFSQAPLDAELNDRLCTETLEQPLPVAIARIAVSRRFLATAGIDNDMSAFVCRQPLNIPKRERPQLVIVDDNDRAIRPGHRASRLAFDLA